MANSRLTKKERKNRIKSTRRKLDLKNQSFKPVVKLVDVEKIKEEFKAKLSTQNKTAKNTDNLTK